MSQAKVLSEKEIKKVIKVIDAKRHATRNRCMFLLTHGSGMRVGEVAALRLCDVLMSDGSIKSEVFLSAQQTKGSKGRTVYLSEKMREEIKLYLMTRFKLKDLLAVTLTDTSAPLLLAGSVDACETADAFTLALGCIVVSTRTIKVPALVAFIKEG